MANRSFILPQGGLVLNVVKLYTSITFGASGAVTSFTGVGSGIKSVVKNTDAGDYTVTLEDSYNSLLGVAQTLVEADVTDPTSVATAFRVSAQAVSTATPTISIQGYDFTDGEDANPASGSVLMLEITLKNSSV